MGAIFWLVVPIFSLFFVVPSANIVPDPEHFGLPGSGSFNLEAKIWKKLYFRSIVTLTFNLFYLNTDVPMVAAEEINRIRIHNQWYRSADPDPFQDVTDPDHWFLLPI
jgi:hypothetical protein